MRTSKAGESALLLLDAVELLERRNVRYAIVGALAAAVHGVVRASMDADLVLSLALPQAGDLERAFAAEGFRTALTRGDADDPIAAMLRLSDAFGNRADLLIGLCGLDPEALQRAIEVSFQGTMLRFIGREDFIAMKAFAGGPVDLMDARRAVVAAGGTLDQELLRRLARGFGREAAATLEKVLAG